MDTPSSSIVFSKDNGLPLYRVQQGRPPLYIEISEDGLPLYIVISEDGHPL